MKKGWSRLFGLVLLFLCLFSGVNSVNAKVVYVFDNRVTYDEKVRSAYTGKPLNGKYDVEVWIHEIRPDAPYPEQVYAFRYQERHRDVEIVDGVVDLDIGSQKKIPIFESPYASVIIVIRENWRDGMEVGRITPPRFALKRVEIPDSMDSSPSR